MRQPSTPPRKARPKTNLRRPVAVTQQAKQSRFAGVDWRLFRFKLAAALFGVLWLTLWGRAFHVQVLKGPELEEMATRQHSYTELVEAKRGNIYDRNGQVLARSVECRSVYANPRAVQDPLAAATALAPLLKLDVASVQRLLAQDRSFVWLARKIDDATALAVQKASLNGIGLSREYERVYPFKHLAGQLLGFVGLDNAGMEGLERSFNETLAGTSQRNVVQRDGTGRGFYQSDDTDTQGKDIKLTLDVQIQFIAEDVIAEAVENAKARWGGVMIADVATGDVLAWAQYPFFNPNSYRISSPSEYRNRLAADALEPGSTLKPFMMAAALEERAIRKDDSVFAENGTWKTNKITIRDDGSHKFGDLRVDKVLAYSSNIGMAKIGLRVGVPTYYRYLSRLGFGRRTGIGVSESKGIVRPPQEWSEQDLMSASFGQSVSMTGLQMTQGYITLANGGAFRPLRLVMDEEGHATTGADQRIFSKATASTVMSMLEEVVEGDGTGTRARIPGLRVAGKTGTAQKAAHGRKAGYGEKRLATFAGIVPANNPRYVVFVMLDEPTTTQYGGLLAAPVFQKVTSRTLAYGGYLPDVVFASQTVQPEAAPARSGRTASATTRTARAASDIVKPGIVPDVRGKSVRRAMEMLANAGLVPEVHGSGRIVARQEPAPGSACAPDPDGAQKACTIWVAGEQTAMLPVEPAVTSVSSPSSTSGVSAAPKPVAASARAAAPRAAVFR